MRSPVMGTSTFTLIDRLNSSLVRTGLTIELTFASIKIASWSVTITTTIVDTIMTITTITTASATIEANTTTAAGSSWRTIIVPATFTTITVIEARFVVAAATVVCVIVWGSLRCIFITITTIESLLTIFTVLLNGCVGTIELV